MTGISVSPQDNPETDMGMIARNPKNHADQRRHNMTNQELNKRFAELCSIPYHTWETKGMDGKMHSHYKPDFVADSRLVLVELVRLNCAGEFIRHRTGTRGHIYTWISDILDTTEGLMVRAAIEFLEAMK